MHYKNRAKSEPDTQSDAAIQLLAIQFFACVGLDKCVFFAQLMGINHALRKEVELACVKLPSLVDFQREVLYSKTLRGI